MKEKKFSVSILAEIAIFAALAFALDLLQGGYSKFWFINGGSVGIAMVPIFIVSYRRGLIAGILCGFIVSLVQMLGGVYVINASNYEGAMKFFSPFFQIALDYVLAYTVVGFAGAFAGMYKNGDKNTKIIAIVLGVLVGGLLKYAMHVLSGGFYWLDGSVSIIGIKGDTWLYTFVYNGLYSIPNIIICGVIMVLIALIYPKFLTPESNEDSIDNIFDEENEIEEINTTNEDDNNEVNTDVKEREDEE